MTAKYGPRLVKKERCDYLRPTVVHCDSPEATIAKKEYMFPFCTVVECPQEKMLEAIGPTLVCTAITKDKKLQRALLDAVGVRYEIDPTLVRGLDYYTRTIFSFVCAGLGAQSEIGGGGRYDGLIEQLGGPPTPAIGWAAGIERILLALGEAEAEARPAVFISHTGDDARLAIELASELRRAGLVAEMDLAGRSVKGQFKHANRIGADLVVVLGDGAVELRDMESGEQDAVERADLVAEIVRRRS